MGFYPAPVALQQDNTQVYVSEKTSPLTNKLAAQSSTNNEEHITANEQNVRKEK
jgi:hypothetical protein